MERMDVLRLLVAPYLQVLRSATLAFRHPGWETRGVTPMGGFRQGCSVCRPCLFGCYMERFVRCSAGRLAGQGVWHIHKRRPLDMRFLGGRHVASEVTGTQEKTAHDIPGPDLHVGKCTQRRRVDMSELRPTEKCQPLPHMEATRMEATRKSTGTSYRIQKLRALRMEVVGGMSWAAGVWHWAAPELRGLRALQARMTRRLGNGVGRATSDGSATQNRGGPPASHDGATVGRAVESMQCVAEAERGRTRLGRGHRKPYKYDGTGR